MSIQNLTNGASITCHAWNGDKTRVALCPNSSQVLIMMKNGNGWQIEHRLDQHDSVVTGIDWAPKSNRLVTCSQDRNAYVWQFDTASKTWKPDLVILRINRAATDVKWSPLENKFAVASGAKIVSVCHFEEENDWWVSEHIKKHRSTVTKIAWHPNNQLLATASTDFKARIFNAAVKGVDKRPEQTAWGPVGKFGDLVAKFDCSGWVHTVAFSPSGESLCFAGHDSTMSFVDTAAGTSSSSSSSSSSGQNNPENGNGMVPTVLKLALLPFVDCIYLDEAKVVAVGHDCAPYLFSADAPGDWKLVKCLDEKPKGAAAAGADDRFKKFQSMVDKGTSDAASIKTTVDTRHQNTVTCVRALARSGPRVTEFTTSGLDGAIAWWK